MQRTYPRFRVPQHLSRLAEAKAPGGHGHSDASTRETASKANLRPQNGDGHPRRREGRTVVEFHAYKLAASELKHRCSGNENENKNENENMHDNDNGNGNENGMTK